MGFYYFLFAFVINAVNCEVFTAVADMEGLLHIENIFITNLRSYLFDQEIILNQVRKKIEEYEHVNKEAKNNASSYLANPINAYLITKRLTKDWDDIRETITSNAAEEMLQNITNHRIHFKNPSEKDLNGVSVALARLQALYKLNTSSLASGNLKGVPVKTKMTANDCHQLGLQLFKARDYNHASQWLSEALIQLNGTEAKQQMAIMEKLSVSYYMQRKYGKALKVTTDLLAVAPMHIVAIRNKVLYESKLKEQKTKYNARPPSTEKKETDPLVYDDIQKDLYAKMCRKELVTTPKASAPLRCRYMTNNSPFLKIAPLKLEEASLDPYIVVYHDVLYDAEIEKIKEFSMPRFKRAGVDIYNDDGSAGIHAEYRISKSAWIRDDEHKLIDGVSRRVRDMTGLSMTMAEALQVVNYGIGGHYEPHFDFALPDDLSFDEAGMGNRIATVLFYMSDVIEGGGTVFPLINVSLWPRKGSAAFWLNLYASGEGDIRTKHAACPVFIGSKWVCNKWLHTIDQELLKPCHLHPDHPAEIVEKVPSSSVPYDSSV